MAYQCLFDKPLLTLFSSSFRPAILIKVNAGGVALSLENYFFGLICRVIFGVHIAHEAYICVSARFLSKLSALIFQLKSKCNLRVAFTMRIYVIFFIGL